jgi:copper homeostasis protein
VEFDRELMQMNNDIAVELCTDRVAGARLAEAAGVARIELCERLDLNGLTPSRELIDAVLAELTTVGLRVMIRPRPGDAVYPPVEVAAMARTISELRELTTGAKVSVGFVLAAVTAAGTVDVAALGMLLDAAAGSPVTFHRAFDELADLSGSLRVLADLGVDRVLTSGGAPTAAAGSSALHRLVDEAGDRITILAGGGVRARTIGPLLAAGVREVHLRATPDGGAEEEPSPAVLADLFAALGR